MLLLMEKRRTVVAILAAKDGNESVFHICFSYFFFDFHILLWIMINDSVMMDLLALILGEEAFTELRTQQQLGTN